MVDQQIRVGEGALDLMPPHPSFDVDTASPPLPQRGEGTTAALAASAHRAGRWRILISRCQTAHPSSFPRRVFAPGLPLLFHTRPKTEGRAERREAHIFRCRAGEARRASLRDALAPRRSTVAIFGRGTRAAISGSAAGSDQHLARAQAMRPGRRGPPTSRAAVRAAAAGRHSPLRLQDRL